MVHGAPPRGPRDRGSEGAGSVTITEEKTDARSVKGPRRPSVVEDTFDDRVTTARLVLRYALTGLLTLVVVALVAAYASRAVGTEAAVSGAVRSTTLAAGVAAEPALTDEVLRGDPKALANLDDTMRRAVIRGNLVRVKMWTADGRIVYSDERRLIGERFEMRDDEQEAIRTGEPKAELSDLTDPENRYEEPMTQLLEVYLPIHTPSGAPVLFEAYYRYSGVAEIGRTVWLRFAPLTVGALILLELLQLPIAAALARRLRRAQGQREELLRRSIEATDEERRRIAGDLHDGVVQDLAGVAFSLGAAARHAEGATAAQTAQAAERVRESVRSLRSLLVEIYPPNLYEEGLEAALSDLLARLTPRGIASSLDIDITIKDLGVEETELLYRVAQEGVRNAVAHADPSRVDVTVHRNEGDLVMCVIDDGSGVEPDAIPEKTGHFGLRALAGLAERLGATLSLESGATSGTVLRLVVPGR